MSKVFSGPPNRWRCVNYQIWDEGLMREMITGRAGKMISSVWDSGIWSPCGEHLSRQVWAGVYFKVNGGEHVETEGAGFSFKKLRRGGEKRDEGHFWRTGERRGCSIGWRWEAGGRAGTVQVQQCFGALAWPHWCPECEHGSLHALTLAHPFISLSSLSSSALWPASPSPFFSPSFLSSFIQQIVIEHLLCVLGGKQINQTRQSWSIYSSGGR